MRKRAFTVLLTAVMVAMTGACTSGGQGGDSDVVRVTLNNHPWTDIVVEHIAEFEEQSGLTVETSILGEDQLSDQYNVRLNAGASDIDVMMLRPLQEANLFHTNGWLEPLNEMIGESDIDWDDFQMQGPVTYDEDVVAIPIVSEQTILYYRTDLLDEAGLEVPTSFEELEQAAATIQESNDGVYGFVARGARAAAVTQFAGYLYGFGGDWDDGAGNATLDTPEAHAAYDYYASMLTEYGPPGTTNMSWQEASAIFQQGQAAFYSDGSVFYNNMIDPEQSRIGDDVGFARLPGGPAGSKPTSVPSWALAINSGASNTEGAWEFIQWATSPELMLEVQLAGVTGTRTSVWESEGSLSAFPDQLAEVLAASAADGVDYDRPMVVEVGQARDIVGAPLVALQTGEDLDAALSTAQSQYQTLLDEEESRAQ